MKLRSFRLAGGPWIWILAALAVILAAVGYHRFGMHYVSSSTTLRIGMQDSPPWYSQRSDGVIEGPVYDIVAQAARRRMLNLIWVTDASGPDHALTAGSADIWPLMGRLPSRMDTLDVTDSWLDLRYLLCSARPCLANGESDGNPRTIAHRGTQVTNTVLSERYSAAKPLVVSSHTEALAAVCAGKVEAALISDSAQPVGLLSAPAACRDTNLCLRITPVTTIGFGIGSRRGSREARAAAIVLRAEIDNMIDDGTLPGILVKWGVSSGEVRALRAGRLAKTREWILIAIAAILIAALLVLWIVHRRLLAAKQHAVLVQMQLRKSQASLEAEFQRHTELEARYHQAQKLESLGRLAGGVAHDFNNLLTVINGFSDLLLAQFPEGGKWRRSVEQISKAGNRGAELTRQLLVYSRHQDVELTPVNLNDVVSDMASLLRTLAGSSIRVEFNQQSDIGCVMADRGKLNRLLMNLVVNARDAMPGGGTLQLETANVNISSGERAGGYARLVVSDTGVGMDQSTLSRIFEPFFTTKQSDVGTGMGLPIVQSVVNGLGGWVDVESTPGEGSRFLVFLPLAAGPIPPAAVQSA